MDSNNPFTFSTNFIDLLNSQEEKNTMYPFYPISPSTQIISSKIPQYNTQYDNMGGESNDPNQTNARKETRCKWSPTEDGVLISA